MLPIPNLPDADFKEAGPFVDRGLRARMYRFSPDHFKDITAVWTGEHPIAAGHSRSATACPRRTAAPPTRPRRGLFAPGYHPNELKKIADQLLARAWCALRAPVGGPASPGVGCASLRLLPPAGRTGGSRILVAI